MVLLCTQQTKKRNHTTRSSQKSAVCQSWPNAKNTRKKFLSSKMPSTKNTHRCPSQQEEGGPSGKWTQQQEVDIDLISSHSSPPTSRRNSLLHSNSRGSSRDSSRLTPPRPTCENSTSIPRSIGQEVRIRDPCLREV